MSGSNVSRRARARLEHAFAALETAYALGRDPRDAEMAWLRASEGAGVDVARDERRKALEHAREHRDFRAYARAHGLGGARMWTASGPSGARFYRLVTEAFRGHFNYVYLIEIDDQLVLWDCGSGLDRSRAMLLDGMALLAKAFDVGVEPADIDVVMISHGHYDHFGDAKWWKEQAQAPLWIHELDARVVERFEERTAMTARDMAVWLGGAGLDDDENKRLVRMYLESKDVYHSVPVDRRLRHAQKLFSGHARVIHTPGHCPGHMCLRIDDVVLVADQVLAPITPHLSPQALHPSNGIASYLSGIGRLAREEGVRTVLPAHYDEIPDLGARIREIAEDHVEKLRVTLRACADGARVVDVARELFGPQEGYNVLLAVLEAGSHVEYLHQLGALCVVDVDAVANDPRAPVRYRATGVDPQVLE